MGEHYARESRAREWAEGLRVERFEDLFRGDAAHG
jgi:hypothetical protein